MARQFLTSIDHGFKELKGLRIENRTNAPSNPQDGYVYFDTVNDTYRLYQNGAWFELATSGVLVGTLAQRPGASAATIGTLYWASDTNIMYIDEGGTWETVGGGEGGGPHDHEGTYAPVAHGTHLDPTQNVVLQEWTSGSETYRIIAFAGGVDGGLQLQRLMTGDSWTSGTAILTLAAGQFTLEKNDDGYVGIYTNPGGVLELYASAGIQVTSALTVQTPTADNHAATKKYVDDRRISYESFARAGVLLVVNGKGRFTFPVAGTITGWSASVGTAPTGAGVVLRLNRNGISLDTGTIAAGANAMAQRNLNQNVVAGDYVTLDITGVGSTTPGEDLSVVMAWRPS